MSIRNNNQKLVLDAIQNENIKKLDVLLSRSKLKYNDPNFLSLDISFLTGEIIKLLDSYDHKKSSYKVDYTKNMLKVFSTHYQPIFQTIHDYCE